MERVWNRRLSVLMNGRCICVGKTEESQDSVCTGIRTRYRPNTSQKRYRLNEIPRWPNGRLIFKRILHNAWRCGQEWYSTEWGTVAVWSDRSSELIQDEELLCLAMRLSNRHTLLHVVLSLTDESSFDLKTWVLSLIRGLTLRRKKQRFQHKHTSLLSLHLWLQSLTSLKSNLGAALTSTTGNNSINSHAQNTTDH